MAVSDSFVLLVNNNLCIIGAKKIVISLSLAVEDGRAWIERSVICVLFLLLMKLDLSLFSHHTWITINWQCLYSNMKADNQSPVVKSETFKLKTLIFLDSISVSEQMKVQEMRGQTIDSMENESRLNFLHIYIIYNTRSNLPPDQKRRRRRISCNNWHRCCAVH